MTGTTKHVVRQALTVAVAAILAFSTTSSASAAEKGDKVPSFDLPTLDGGRLSLDSLRGNIILLSFWASWCPPCKKEFPAINNIARDYEGRGVKVIAVSIDKARSNVRRFLIAEGHDVDRLKLTVLRDAEAQTVAGFNANSMPTSYIIDGTGIVRFVHPGYRDEDATLWRQEIDSLLSEREGDHG